jgi:hypothetical protein
MSTFYLDNIVEAEKRINHPKNLLNGADFKTVGQGQHDYRGDGNRKQYRKLSPETKGLVSALAQVSGVKETAKNLGIPPIMVSRYKNGMTADGTNADPEVRQEAKSILTQSELKLPLSYKINSSDLVIPHSLLMQKLQKLRLLPR